MFYLPKAYYKDFKKLKGQFVEFEYKEEIKEI